MRIHSKYSTIDRSRERLAFPFVVTILQVAKREKEDEIYTLERKYESKSICFVIISVATRNLG